MTPNPEKHLHNPEFEYTPAVLTCLRAKWDRDFPGWNKPSAGVTRKTGAWRMAHGAAGSGGKNDEYMAQRPAPRHRSK